MSNRVELVSVILAKVTDFIITIVVFAMSIEELWILPVKNTVFKEKKELLMESTEGEERGIRN